MPWNPNVPNVINRVQDDLDAIRENFQVLDAHLADTNNPHQVTAAQVGAPTQAEFDSHVNNTNNPHNVQAQQVPYSSGVAGFSPADVKAALDALAGVRIVEMGSNANGTYVCWENGLQVCWKRLVASDFPTTDQTATVQGLTYRFRTYTWTFPKPFAVVPIVFASGDVSGAAPEHHAAFTSSTTTAQCEAGTLRSTWNYDTGNVLAIGPWK